MQRATASSKAIFAWIPSPAPWSRAVQAAQIAAYRLVASPFAACGAILEAGPAQTGRQAPLPRSSFQRAARSFAEREARKAEMID